LVKLFPAPVDIAQKLISQRGQDEREKFPTKPQLKSAIDTAYKSMKDHYTFLQILTPYTQGNPEFKDINLRCNPEVYAKVFALLAFVTTGDDAKLQDKNIRALRTHGDVGKCNCIRYGTVRYGTVRYGTVRYGTVRYGTVSIVRYGTVLDTVRY
jgi:hypothetical protein